MAWEYICKRCGVVGRTNKPKSSHPGMHPSCARGA